MGSIGILKKYLT